MLNNLGFLIIRAYGSKNFILRQPHLFVPALHIPFAVKKNPLVKKQQVIAVSPIIQGKTVKGPAAKMARELGLEASSAGVLGHYADFVDGFIYDQLDGDIFTSDAYPGIIKKAINTIMKNDEDKLRLAIETLKLGEFLINNTHHHD